MIGKLRGVFIGYYGSTAIIDVSIGNISSIGYEITLKQSDLLSLKCGDIVSVFIKEIVTEDSDVLYGFLSFEDKCWFEELVKLSGLGPKTALAILSTYSCNAITDAIMMNDCSFFSSISGIGAKIANRIPIEMKKQIAKINEKVLNFCDYSIIGNNDKPSCNVDDVGKLLQHGNSDDATNMKDKNDFSMDASAGANKILSCRHEKKNHNDKKQVAVQKTTIKTVNDAIAALVALGFNKHVIYNEVFAIVKGSTTLQVEEIIKKFLQKINQ